MGWFGRGLQAIGRVIFWRPLAGTARLVFRFVLLPLYSRYVIIKQRVKRHPAFAGLENVGHFFQRYALYAGLVAFGILAVSNNIFARTIRPDEIGQGAIWTDLVPGNDPDVVVETTILHPLVKNTAGTLAIGGPAPAAVVNTAPNDVETGDEVLMIGENIATTDTTETERADVVQYTIQPGDTVSTIAENFGLTTRTVLWANGLSDQDYIRPGQTIKIPPQSGYLYTVKSGDTLGAIARKYQGNEEDILAANHLAAAEAIQIGDQIIIPNGVPPAPPAPPASSNRSFIGRFLASDEAPPSAPPGGGRWRWPTSGRKINQYYRGRWHTGLDVEGDYSSPIYAAGAGTVTFAAFDRSGYGLHVIIDHGNGYRTLYGHASKVFVHVGQHVTRGQTIAMVGSTGRSTGTHLHFEIRTGGGFINPLSQL